MERRFPQLRCLTRGARFGVLWSLLALALAAALPIAWSTARGAGIVSALAAVGVCALGASVALGWSDLCNRRGRALWGMLGAMLARTAMPLAIGMALHAWGGPLVTGGFVYYLLVFYLVGLTVETTLSLPMPSGGRGSAGVSAGSRNRRDEPAARREGSS